MAHMAQNGNIRVCSLCEGWQILSEEIAFGSGINFIFISVAGRMSQFFSKVMVFNHLATLWQLWRCRKKKKNRSQESGQFIYGIPLLQLSSCRQGKSAYVPEFHGPQIACKPWWRRMARLSCQVWVWCCVRVYRFYRTWRKWPERELHSHLRNDVDFFLVGALKCWPCSLFQVASSSHHLWEPSREL